MTHHVRSSVAIAFALGYLGISSWLEHRPADLEYVFLMFVVFSSAMQDALDEVNHRLVKLASQRDIKQEMEYLKSHITGQANLVKCDVALLKYDLALAAALERGEGAPEARDLLPAYPEPKFIPPYPEPFDAKKWRTEKLHGVAAAVDESTWLDMSVVTYPLRRLVTYIMGRPAFVRWIVGE
jgi:hypothetical protein